jgi:hypothetical protein
MTIPSIPTDGAAIAFQLLHLDATIFCLVD